MRLVAVALLDENLGLKPRDLLERLGHRKVGKAGECLVDRAVGVQVLEVADYERPAGAPRPAPLPEGDHLVAGEALEMLLGAEHGTPERVVAEAGYVDQLAGHRGGLVLVALDLLDDHPALAVEFVRVDLRASDEVGEQVDRGHRRLGTDGDVEGDEVVAGVGVERASHPLGCFVDLAVVVVDLAPLEDQVLEKMGHSVLVGPLGSRAGVEGDEDRGGPGPRYPDPVNRKPVARR